VRYEKIPVRRDHRAEEGDRRAKGLEHDGVEQRLRWQLRRWRRSTSRKGARRWWWRRRDSSRHGHEVMAVHCLGEEAGTSSRRRADISPSKKRKRERDAPDQRMAWEQLSTA
jgi:hypothetical protein